MAEIVVMNLWRDRKGRQVQDRRGTTAPTVPGELVLFTGVRYERFETIIERAVEASSMRAEQN